MAISKSLETVYKLDSVALQGNSTTFTSSVSAPSLSGVHYGDGSNLTGIVTPGGLYAPLSGDVGFGGSVTSSTYFFGNGAFLAGLPPSVPNVGGSLFGGLSAVYDYSSFGVNWTMGASSRNWQDVATSFDGATQIAVVNGGQVYTSQDYGNTFTAADSNRNWQAVSMSSSGVSSIALVYGGSVYRSTNSGATWTQLNSPIAIVGNKNWQDVAMSADGRKVTAMVKGGQIYISTNGGDYWTTVSSNRNWQAIAMSYDGVRQTAIVSGGKIYTSTDSGTSWWPANVANDTWQDIAMSGDGKYQTAITTAAGSTYIYRSVDYGINWVVATSEPGDWYSVAMTSDGSHQMAITAGGLFYFSSDFGATWTYYSFLNGTFWVGVANCIAMTPDGSHITIAEFGGQTYTSNTLPYVKSKFGSVESPTGTFTTSISSPALSGVFYGDGSKLTGIVTGSLNNYVPLSGGALTGNLTTTVVDGVGTINSLSSTPTVNLYTNLANPYSSLTIGSQMLSLSTAGFGVNPSNGTSGSVGHSWMSMSDSGQYRILAVYAGRTYVSQDYGTTWTAVSGNLSKNWSAVEMTSNGLTAYGSVSNSNDHVYKLTYIPSLSAYSTWVQMTTAANYYGNMAVTSNGLTAIVGDNFNGHLYTTKDGGLTWVQTSKTNFGGSGNCNKVAMSRDGVYQAVGMYSAGNTYKSNDGGATWTQTYPNGSFWNGFKMSGNGQYRLISNAGINANTNGYAYWSNDYGVTWINLTGVNQPGSKVWQTAAVSDDGRYQFLGEASGYIWCSKDYGVTWTNRKADGGFSSISANWIAMDVSTDNTYFCAATNNVSAYNFKLSSFDSPQVWANSRGIVVPTLTATNVTGPNGTIVVVNSLTGTSASFTTVSSTSASFTYVTGPTTFTTSISAPALSGVHYGDASKLTGVAFTSATPSTPAVTLYNTWMGLSAGSAASPSVAGAYTSLAMSDDGSARIMSVYGGQSYTSNDYGVTWTAVPGALSKNWAGVDMTANGLTAYGSVGAAGSSYIYKTTYSAGAWSSWVQMTTNSAYYDAIKTSANGLTAIVGGEQDAALYTTKDGGLTWVATVTASAGNKDIIKVAMSRDAVYQSFAMYDAGANKVYVSNDGGANFTSVSYLNIAGSAWWLAFAMSGNGQYRLAGYTISSAVGAGPLFASNDYGVTWTNLSGANQPGSRVWQGAALSYDGRYQVLVESGGYIWCSRDYGATWTTRSGTGGFSSLSANWSSVDMSFDGSYVLAATSSFSAVNYKLSSYDVPQYTTANVTGINGSVATFTNYRETTVTGSLSSPYTINFLRGSNFILNLSAGVVGTIIVPSPSNDTPSFTMFITQPSTTTTTAVISSVPSIKWMGGVAPSITNTVNKTDIISLVTDGTYWYGTYAQNF